MCDDTQAQKAADIEFFDKTKAACEMKSDDTCVYVYVCVYIYIYTRIVILL